MTGTIMWGLVGVCIIYFIFKDFRRNNNVSVGIFKLSSDFMPGGLGFGTAPVNGNIHKYLGEVIKTKFYVFIEDTICIQKYSSKLFIELKRAKDGRIVPVRFSIKDEQYQVVDRNGNFLTKGNLEDISIARTLNYIRQILTQKGITDEIVSTCESVLTHLIIYNLLLKREVIKEHTDSYVMIDIVYNNNDSFEKIYNEITGLAEQTIEKYKTSINRESTDKIKVNVQTQNVFQQKEKHSNTNQSFHTIDKNSTKTPNTTDGIKGTFSRIYDYQTEKEYVDSLVDFNLPDLYEQCMPIMTKLMESFWLEWTNSHIDSYREFNQSAFATNLYKRHFYHAFKNGWKNGFFSLGQVNRYEDLLEKELHAISDICMSEATQIYPEEFAIQFIALLAKVHDIGFASGSHTPINQKVYG
jgi:hypothetical protein